MTREFLPPAAQEWYKKDNQAEVGRSMAELAKQATRHEKNRLDTVAETLALVGLLFQRGVLLGNEVITVRGAIFQSVSGSQVDRTQAAHCIPGWLQFNSLPLHEMDAWNVPDLQSKGFKPLPFSSKVRNLAMRVDVMADTINIADSYVEKMSDRRGLKSTLRRVVELLIHRLQQRRSTDPWVLFDELVNIVATYRDFANYACAERLDNLVTEIKVTREPAALAKLQAKAHVIRTYVQVVKDHSVTPEPLTNKGFESLQKDVLAFAL
jgi:hypothetical protein